jgi:hypothetical protein
MTTKVPEFISDIVARLKSMDRRYLYLILAIIFLIVSVIIFFAVRNRNAQRAVVLPILNQSILATPTLIQLPQTPTPVASSEWEVIELLGESTVDGYTSLDVSFKNSTSGEIKKGHCQSRHDPAPVLTDIYTLVSTGYMDKNGQEVLLFVPHILHIEQPDKTILVVEVGVESKHQRFKLIP